MLSPNLYLETGSSCLIGYLWLKEKKKILLINASLVCPQETYPTTVYRVKTLCLFLNLSFGLDIENVTILSRTPCAKKCSSVTMTLKLKVKLNNLQILTCLHFPPSWLFLFTLSSSSSHTLFTLVWKRDEDLNVIEREESRLAVEHAFVPVFVDLIGQSDDVALVEAQLSLVFWLKVVQGLTAGLLQAWVYTGKERMRKIRLGRDQKNGEILIQQQDTLRVRDRSSVPLEKTTCIVLHTVFEIWWHKNHTMLWHHIPVCVTPPALLLIISCMLLFSLCPHKDQQRAVELLTHKQT